MRWVGEGVCDRVSLFGWSLGWAGVDCVAAVGCSLCPGLGIVRHAGVCGGRVPE